MSIPEIFSLRIVTADFYMEKPKPGLDPCFSEFRAKEIKKVPIIRIFGSTPDGQKACMHVHGVFPYLYIPFDKKSMESLDKAEYLVASSLDKAINISLGQSIADIQHVFKIQLVKGIPFYGYHSKEHQFLKIYLFNPRFIKRAANLLQNGAIMSKTFHAHESHVPYILQFFIDFNLYGMSFLHIPKEILKFRRNREDENIPFDVSENQILNCSIATKQSTSKLELDIMSGFILNRFQLYSKQTSNANPGIESIWQDEKVRRQNLEKHMDNVPPLAIPPDEPRPNVKPAESEDFYRTGLETKLHQLETTSANDSINETLEISTSVVKEKKRTFNLKNLLTNAVYPEECTQEDILINASFIPNHFSNGSLFEQSSRFTKFDSTPDSDSTFLDDTIVDEEVIRSLTQQEIVNRTLRDEDLNLLDVMQQLEEEQEENNIDLDSTLAPLSQNINFNDPQQAVAQKLSHETNSSGDESDNECAHDFTMIMDDMDDLLLKLSQPSLPDVEQCDGADDLLRTPKKSAKSRLSHTPSLSTPKRNRIHESPRTPKSTAKKYEPLPLIIKSRSVRKNLTTETSRLADVDSPAVSSMHRFEVTSEKRRISNRRKTINLDKTHITCELKPARRKSELKLRTYSTENSDYEPIPSNSKKKTLKPTKKDSDEASSVASVDNREASNFHTNKMLNEIKINCLRDSLDRNQIRSLDSPPVNISQVCWEYPKDSPSDSNSSYKLSKISPKVRLKRSVCQSSPLELKMSPITKIKKSPQDMVAGIDTVGMSNEPQNNSVNEKNNKKRKNRLALKSKERSRSEIRKPSTQTLSKKLRIVLKRLHIPDQSTPVKKITLQEKLRHIKDQSTPTTSVKKVPFKELLNTVDVKTISQSSPSISGVSQEELFKETEDDNMIDSFCEQSFLLDNTICVTPTMSQDGIIVIKPKYETETYREVKQNYKLHDIPDVINKKPFYGNYLDVTARKEVGHTILSIPGTTLNDVEDFKSSIGGLESFSHYRRKMLSHMAIQFKNDESIKKYLSSSKTVIATPSRLPPSREDAKIWLKAKELLKRKDNDVVEEEKSPVKPMRKNVLLMGAESGSDSEDMDCSMNVLSLTPLTPIKIDIDSPKELKNANQEKECIVSSQESTDSVSEINASDVARAELGRLTFLNNLHNSQGSFDSSFGISSASLNNTFGFKVNLENLQQAKSDIEHTYLTTLSLEIFVTTRQELLPNPEFDAITCLFYAIENSMPSSENSSWSTSGIILINLTGQINPKINGLDSSVEIKEYTNEIEGLNALLELCAKWDPDIFVGYEIEMASWGYVLERAKYLDLNIAPLLSRVPSQTVRSNLFDEDRDQLTDLDVETKLCGRILLDVWRLMRSEIALTSYTFENVMYHILHRRCPLHTHSELSKWFLSPQTRWIVFEYYLDRVHGTLKLLDQLDLIGRTSEMAKLIGIQFYEVLSRGSQFRVESMMLRIAKPKNLVPISPSVQQRAHMRAPEYLPLILEPQSRFYPDPVIVLDFQSLYPSMIMAYNYCFSTCLGRVEHLGQSEPFEFGASQLRTSTTLLKQLLKRNLVTISPCGVVFIKKEVREGVLPRMLKEILDTRQMVKQSMKLHKNNTALQRILHSRQLGLKLIANVTYGYTAANFSGRMPCVEVGDSVVAKGRETLERAIKLVEAHEEWNVKVVYGDTDSLFVLVPGRNREEAFRIGAEIAEMVTKDNPQPVKLKLEKVYQPCILQTKKRYVGYMYESPEQNEPIFEAKGIETVRRDGCPAAVKMLEKTLRLLFDSADVSRVKEYVCRQFTKLLSGKANVQDLIFAKEFRGLKGYKPTACVPALEMTRKWIQTDPRKIPRSGERVQFIITNGPPGLPLIKLIRSPHEVLADEGLKINVIYYITKAIIPPLNRCLLLIGADANEWFASLPRKILFNSTVAHDGIPSNAMKKSTISQYFSSTKCIVDCGRQTKEGICSLCSKDKSKSMVVLEDKISKLQRGYFLTQFICQACCGRSGNITCASFDCPVLYVMELKKRDQSKIAQIRSIMHDWI